MQASQRLPLQRRITLNVLAVLIQSGGTDALRVDAWKEVAVSGVTPGLQKRPKLCCGKCQHCCAAPAAPSPAYTTRHVALHAAHLQLAARQGGLEEVRDVHAAAATAAAAAHCSRAHQRVHLMGEAGMGC